MVIILLTVCFFLNLKCGYAITDTASVHINAAINLNEINLNGYTSPKSKVELNSIGVYAVTFSDSLGYFEFKNIILPKNYSDLCVNSIDDSNRYSNPVCIPPPPHTNYFTEIGPVILPPTLTINNSSIKPNSTVISSGQAIPNSEIQLYFYKVNDNAKSFPKSVHAYSLPVFSTKSDESGNFSVNLPTAYSSNYRLYASTEFKENFSPKSNTLIYALPSLWQLFFQKNTYFVFTLPFFILTLILFFILLVLKNKPQLSLLTPALRRDFSPAIYPEHLIRSSYIPE
jgi:hypothetical protein